MFTEHGILMCLAVGPTPRGVGGLKFPTFRQTFRGNRQCPTPRGVGGLKYLRPGEGNNYRFCPTPRGVGGLK